MTTKKITRAAIYARVSTEEQVDGTSLDEQVRLCREEATRRGWEVVAEYIDAGISGTDRSRPRWRAMLNVAQQREIDAVVVLKLDRFARRAADILTETDRFIELGIGFVVVDQAIDMSTPAGRMMRTMLAGVAEMERDLIVGRTVAGQRAKAKNGGRPGGEPPFGWRIEGKNTKVSRVVPDENERAVLREAVDCIMRRRMNMQQATDHLNGIGMRPRKAARWNPDVLRRMLANPTLYTGRSIWGATETGSFYKRSHHTRLDRDGRPVHGDPIKIDLGNPPLTEKEHRAIMRTVERRSTRGKSAEARTQMLSTRLVGACGKHYIGVSINGKPYDVYRCTGRKHMNGPDKCKCKQVRADSLDARVWGEIKGLLGSPERLEAMARRWLEVPDDADLSDLGPILAKLDQEIERKQRALTRALDDRYEADDLTEHDERIARFRSELSALRQRRDAHAAMDAAKQERTERLNDLVALAERARGRLESMSDAARREIVQILDIRVTMLGDVVMHLPERVSEPERVRITGIIDPRLFGNGDTQNREGSVNPLPGFPGVAKPKTGVGARPAARLHDPSNPGAENDGGRGLCRPARRHSAQRRGARDTFRPRAARAHLRRLSACCTASGAASRPSSLRSCPPSCSSSLSASAACSSRPVSCGCRTPPRSPRGAPPGVLPSTPPRSCPGRQRGSSGAATSSAPPSPWRGRPWPASSVRSRSQRPVARSPAADEPARRDPAPESTARRIRCRLGARHRGRERDPRRGSPRRTSL
ncbi:hypothetical protein GCM10022239_11810 [Leifsonia bigeumensis]|uniref:Recombinase family protein n=1 Tax=Leifsonella bigeumensis TaxID=433643 RepID=A0ABP7FFG8_9MICO